MIEFPTVEVVAVACAVYRTQGFIKKGSYSPAGEMPNVHFLYEHFLSNNTYAVTDEDRANAEEIVNYLKGLSFKAFERKLSDFETNVLRFVNSNTADKSKLGIAASLPNVYATKLVADTWTLRESELGATSEYIGQLSSRGEFSLTVENLRYIAKTESYLVSCSEGGRNIVKFFVVTTDRIKVGCDITVTGYVKSQAVSNYTGFKETMLNRIRLVSSSVDDKLIN